MGKVTIWNNPRCSKSRETLALLQTRHMGIRIIEYLKTPPSAAEIERALALLRMQPREFMRTNENEYREHDLDDPKLTRAQLIEALHERPILIQRPVVFVNGKARIGRPPETALEIL
ncbi:MAG: arsenate reductase (glutaredoxin) [Gammaproteobacteria bacterium]